MNMLDGAEDDLDDLATVEEEVENAEEMIERYGGLMDDLKQNLADMNVEEIAMLYAEQDIPYDAARKMEEMVDKKYEMAGQEPFFANRPEEERPSEMYRRGDYEPEGVLERIGATIWGDK